MEFFVFIVIMGIVGLLKQISEQTKAKKEAERLNEKRPTAEDLPEATRRMLYGSPEVPRPDGSPPPRPRPVAVPIPTARPRASAPPAAPPQPARRQQMMSTLLETLEEALPEAFDVDTIRKQRLEAQRRESLANQQAEKQRTLAKQQRREQQEAHHKKQQVEQQRHESERKMRIARPSLPVHRILRNKSELRRAIVLREILGPPKAME